MTTNTRLFFLLCTLFGVVFTNSSRAQLVVNLQLNKKQYVAYEPIRATVTVYNRAGRDVVLGGPGGSSWLTLDVSTTKGRRILPLRGGAMATSMVLKAGESVSRNLSMGRVYPLATPQNYKVKASAYFDPFKKFFSSRPAYFTVNNGKKIWEEVAGVPKGRPGGGSYRRYSLLTHRDNKGSSLFVRVTNEQTKRVLATYSLGRMLRVRPPRATLDGDSRMHVLFMYSPKTYLHSVIDVDGTPIIQEAHKEAGPSIPTLVMGSSGRVSVNGGYTYDPSAVAQQPDEGRVRRTSERPVGLPR